MHYLRRRIFIKNMISRQLRLAIVAASFIDPLKNILKRFSIVTLILVMVFPFPRARYRNAKSDPVSIRQIQAIEANEIALTNPAGLAFSSKDDAFHIVNTLQTSSTDLDFVKVDQLSEWAGSVRIADGLQNPMNMTFDNQSNRLPFLNGQANPLLEVRADADGNLNSAAANFTSSLIRTTNMAAISPPSPDPSGIAYVPSKNTLLVVDGEVEETVSGITHFQGANVWELSLSGSKVRTANISKISPTMTAMTNEPTGVALNPGNGHYYVTDDDDQRVYDLNPGADGLIGTSDDTWTYFSTQAAGSGDPEGISFNTWNNHIFVADGVNKEIYEFTMTGSLINHFDVQKYGVVDPESVEFNSKTGTLFTMSSNKASPIIVETKIDGTLLQTINISITNAQAAAGLAYAPASDGSGRMRFYIVDRGIDNYTNPNLVDGKMYEITAPVYTATFSDVPTTHWAWGYIEHLYSDGITSGCNTSPMKYCPTTMVTRDQMAVFLLRGKHGASYVPPTATGVFQDVPTSYWAASWIEQLAAEGITSGCSLNPKQYCPTAAVTRDQMAIFLLRAKYGSGYVPPSATGVFQDVPTDYWAAAWIEQLAAEGITSGCSVSPQLYCPTTPVTRDQMAIFLVKSFNLP